MANARKSPAKSGESDREIHEQLNAVARNLVARAGEHFESVSLFVTYRDSHGKQRACVWTDGGDYAAYACAKDYVIRAEEEMRTGTFAPGDIEDDREPA